jgi:hypothetical protein
MITIGHHFSIGFCKKKEKKFNEKSNKKLIYYAITYLDMKTDAQTSTPRLSALLFTFCWSC